MVLAAIVIGEGQPSLLERQKFVSMGIIALDTKAKQLSYHGG